MLIRVAKLFAFLLMAGTLVAAAETSDSTDPSTGQDAANPVAQVRQNKSWEYGPFVTYSNGIGTRSDFHFLSAGFQVGKPLTPVLHAGILTGQFELGGNIMPLWQAYTPAPHPGQYICPGDVPCTLPVGGGIYRGVSITPAIFRWNFVTRSRRVQPWFQAAGGLIYTTREFPPNYGPSTQYPDVNGSTSVWNFSPQGGGGLHYFIRPKRSIDLGVNAMHISSASLGDHNPGVNASIQVQLGYTFWK